MATTPHLGLPLMAAAQSQKHVTHNMALMLLDAITQCSVQALDVNDPPASPAAGDCYGIGSAPTGAFASAARQFALYDGYVWQFMPVHKGYLVFNLADSQFWFYDGVAWKQLSESLPLPSTFSNFNVGSLAATTLNATVAGIGTVADANNTLAAKLNSALFTAKSTTENGTGDMRLSLNKQSAANNVSQLYQTNYSGRAETGLTGDDNFHLKVSPDGTNWKEALVSYGASAAVRIDQLLSGRTSSVNKGRIECDFTAPNSVGAVFSDTSAVANAPAVLFRKNNTQVGSISLTATGTSYATTSDYRVKISHGPIANSLSRLAQLKPIRFAYQSDPATELDGFLAHEVAAVVPEAVIGKKDAIDEKGEPVLQGLDAARLIPLLVAALQDLSVRLERLEAKTA